MFALATNLGYAVSVISPLCPIRLMAILTKFGRHPSPLINHMDLKVSRKSRVRRLFSLPWRLIQRNLPPLLTRLLFLTRRDSHFLRFSPFYFLIFFIVLYNIFLYRLDYANKSELRGRLFCFIGKTSIENIWFVCVYN